MMQIFNNKKVRLDLSVYIICMLIFLLTLFYVDDEGFRTDLINGSLLLGLFSCFLFIYDALKAYYAEREEPELSFMDHRPGKLTRLSLINEDGKIIRSWELFDRIALVIGRDVGENHVDVDLHEAAYASLIEIEHAVLNFSGGYWYIEDLGSKNGVRVKKAVDGKIYQMAADQPCRLDAGDILILGLTHLQID